MTTWKSSAMLVTVTRAVPMPVRISLGRVLGYRNPATYVQTEAWIRFVIDDAMTKLLRSTGVTGPMKTFKIRRRK